VTHHRTSAWSDSARIAGATRGVWVCRSLLFLLGLSLLSMPLTQYFWTWDRFLHGGQDFELGALMVLTNIALGLVLSICRGWRGRTPFAPSQPLTGEFATRALIGAALRAQLPACRTWPAPGPAPDYRIPLQI
jgi:hypothetical protein